MILLGNSPLETYKVHAKRKSRKHKQKRIEMCQANIKCQEHSKNGHIIYNKVCWACGCEFSSKRMDALTCRASCNTRIYRYLNKGITPVSGERMKELIKDK